MLIIYFETISEVGGLKDKSVDLLYFYFVNKSYVQSQTNNELIPLTVQILCVYPKPDIFLFLCTVDLRCFPKAITNM